MHPLRIKIIKKTYHEDLEQEFLTGPAETCELFQIGQEFIVNNLKMPEKFCGWAWHDIQRALTPLLFEGNFKEFGYKNPNSIITCCTDGMRPVTFLIEKIEEDRMEEDKE